MNLSSKRILLVTFLISYFTFNWAAPANTNGTFIGEEVSPEVFRASYTKRMKSYMNTSIDPCTDFYDYACGNYPNVMEDIELVRKQDVFYDLMHSMDKTIDEILQKKRQPEEKYYEELQKVKYFVEVCDRADLFPLKPNEEFLKTIQAIGGFPAVDPTWKPSEFQWFNMTAHLLRYGVISFIGEEIFMRYPFPPTFEIAKFGFGFDVYPANIETNDSLGYLHNVDMMKRLLRIYGVVGSKADKVIEEIIGFWRKAVVYQDQVKDSCNELEEHKLEDGKFAEWNSLLEISWDIKNASEYDFVPCPCDFYFNKLNVIAKKHPAAFANYMSLEFLFKMHPQVKSAKYQHQHCVTEVKYGLPMVLTYYYMKEHFDKQAVPEIEEMISQISTSLGSMIANNSWLDDTTRRKIQQTFKTLNSTIGQVVDPISDTYIMETRKLNLTSNYALNKLELAKFKVNISHYLYLHKSTIDEAVPYDILRAIMPNAFYNPTEHSINVLASILYPPIYHRALPKSIKYGGLGFIIGHEIVHSLDPKYRQDFQKSYAWSMRSRKWMKNNSNCYIKHHSNITIPELNINLNGKSSVTETICDSSGLRASLMAFRNENDFNRMDVLPGLNFSAEQTFFLNFAQAYCAKYEPRHYWNEVNGGYPMDKYRVTLPLQNFEEFSNAFHCPMGSAMNPEKKCRMW